MRGKEKCKALKEIRRQIAENNDIEYIVSECSHKGDCKGTCPKCEAEVRYLERELERRRNLGKTVVVAGIGAGIVATMSGCNTVVDTLVINPVTSVVHTVFPNTRPQQLEGAAEMLPLEGEPSAPIDSEDGSEIEVLEGDVEYIPDENESEENSENGSEETDAENCSSEEADEEESESKSQNNFSKYELEGGVEYIP